MPPTTLNSEEPVITQEAMRTYYQEHPVLG